MADSSPRSKRDKTQAVDPVAAFIAELRATPPVEHVLFGMVKPADDADGLMFTHAGGCEQWVFIPAAAIRTVAPAGRIRCATHSHAAAEIHLKPPETDREKTFFDLAFFHCAALNRLLINAIANDDPHDCGPNAHWGTNQSGQLGCQPGARPKS